MRAYQEGCGHGVPYTVRGLAVTPKAERHLEGLNLAFVDGHVKWYPADSATALSNVFNKVVPISGTGIISEDHPTFRAS